MADNIAVTAGTGTNVAADEATYSGDTTKVQLVRDVIVSGSEGSKTVTAKSVGAGNADAGTPRVTIATNDAAIAAIVSALGAVTISVLPAGLATTTGQAAIIAALSNIGGTVAVSNFPVTQPVSGTFWQATQPVSLASVPSHAVTNAGTFAVQAAGDVAHDAADSNSPQKVGAKATTSLAGLTLVSDGDRTNLFAGVDGVLLNRPHCNLEDIVSGLAAITDGSSTSVIAAQGAGVKVYVTSVIISNSSATEVRVDIRDGAAGTVKATLPAPANNGGIVVNLPVPLPFSANTAVCADPSAAASTVTVTLIGFKSKI